MNEAVRGTGLESVGRTEIRPSYSVLIIGGGINGCGVFRDLCEQGVDVLLVERGDFCSGASAAPSRLIHGGIKYLETGEFRLVAQSARERNLLLQNAPHYVKPLETFLPVRSWFGGIVPSALRFFGFKTKLTDRGAIITRIGLLLYDLFGRHFRTMPNHKMLGARRAGASMPGLDPEISAVGVYYEAKITHAERLGLELLLDGEKANPTSQALNYAMIERGTDGCFVLTDRISGESRPVKADIVINAGGAWIDAVNAGLGINSRHMGGNKGSHAVVRHPELYNALNGRMVYFGTADGRVNLLYPFMGNILLGATDIPVADPDAAICTDAEIDYMLDVMREVFPDVTLSRDHIAMTYCGVRPLPRSEGLDPGEVSRDHSIAEDKLPGTETSVLSLIGGKWTTFRGFAEEVSDLVLDRLKRSRKRSTERLAIGGGRDFPKDEESRRIAANELAGAFSIAKDDARRLLDRYGTQARALLRVQAGPLSMLKELPDYSRQEIVWFCQAEKIGRLDDILFRRTDIALAGRLTEAGLIEIGAIVAETMAWPQDRLEEELDVSRATAKRNHIAL